MAIEMSIVDKNNRILQGKSEVFERKYSSGETLVFI